MVFCTVERIDSVWRIGSSAMYSRFALSGRSSAGWGSMMDEKPLRISLAFAGETLHFACFHRRSGRIMGNAEDGRSLQRADLAGGLSSSRDVGDSSLRSADGIVRES